MEQKTMVAEDNESSVKSLLALLREEFAAEVEKANGIGVDVDPENLLLAVNKAFDRQFNELYGDVGVSNKREETEHMNKTPPSGYVTRDEDPLAQKAMKEKEIHIFIAPEGTWIRKDSEVNGTLCTPLTLKIELEGGEVVDVSVLVERAKAAKLIAIKI